MSSPLGSPLPLPCGVTLPNRMVKAPMTENLADPSTGLPNDLHFALYRRWTRGGIGAQMTGNVMVDRRYQESSRNIALEAKDESPERLQLYERYASAIQEGGSIGIMQISHPGRQCFRAVNSNGLAPSPISVAVPGVPSCLSPIGPPRAMDLTDIEEVIERFTTTARLAVKAGFKGVQIHSAHGYLLSSFLSPTVNQRTDRYGGSAENRRRLLLEICESVRAAIGPNRILAVKLNSADFQKGGFTEEESLAVLKELEKLKIDFIEISGGTYEKPAMMQTKAGFQRDHAADRLLATNQQDASDTSAARQQPQQRESTRRREAYFIHFCIEAKKVIPTVRLMCSGGWRSGIAMSRVIQAKELDLIGLGRPLCVMPDFPRLLLSSPQLQTPQLENAVEDAITLPHYSLAMHTPSESFNRTSEASLENFVHQQCMYRLAKGEEPNLEKDNSSTARAYYLTFSVVRGFYWDPLRRPKKTFALVTLVTSGVALLVATRLTQQSTSQLVTTMGEFAKQMWNKIAERYM